MSQQSKRKLLAISCTCVIAWFFAYMATNVFKDYAFGLFIWLPLIMGAISTFVYGYKNEITRSTCRDVSFITLAIFTMGLFTFAFEGMICIMMALPIGLLFNWIGYRIAYSIHKGSATTSTPGSLSVLIISVPAFMGIEHMTLNNDEVARPIITSIEINAPVETVWKQVVEFPQLPEPNEFIFKAGIAYPTHATISGRGIGAIRYCHFSTGSFVEPITVWDEPKLLAFDVKEQPEPMQELSMYELHPNHLHGYFVSKKGQFKLTPLGPSKTKLEGTTWYYNKIKPALYWDLWSDYIIHKIHRRVLGHIKIISETAGLVARK